MQINDPTNTTERNKALTLAGGLSGCSPWWRGGLGNSSMRWLVMAQPEMNARSQLAFSFLLIPGPYSMG